MSPSVVTASAIVVRVRLFASYAELVDRETVELTLSPASTVGEALAALRELPGGRALPERPLCAVNLSHVATGTRLNHGDELAVLPPLAGG